MWGDNTQSCGSVAGAEMYLTCTTNWKKKESEDENEINCLFVLSVEVL